MIENAKGGSGNDSILGNNAANQLSGGGGKDTLAGGAGRDTLDGGAGDDRIVGTADEHDGDTLKDFEANDSVVVEDATIKNWQLTYDDSSLKIKGPNAFTLDFENGPGAGDFVAESSGGDTVLRFNPSTSRPTAAGGPEVEVEGKGKPIASNDYSPLSGDGTHFGAVDVGGGEAYATFAIANTGDETLTLKNFRFGGGNAAGDFDFVGSLPREVAPGESAEVEVVFDPSASGTRKANLLFKTNDADEPLYKFALKGEGSNNGSSSPKSGSEPEVAVRGKGKNIADDDATPSWSDGTKFGKAAVDGGNATRSFVIANEGDDDLRLSDFRFTGPGDDSFDFASSLPNRVEAGESATVRVRFDPAEPGKHPAFLRFGTNDADENEFAFKIVGIGTEDFVS